MARDPFMIRMGLRRRPDTLVASGEHIDLGDISAIDTALSRRQAWQQQSLDAYDSCPEVYYGVEFLAGLMSRLVLFAAERPDRKDAEPVASSSKDVIDTIERLGTPVERAEIQRNLGRQILLPGEAYLIGLQPAENRKNVTEEWQIRSIFELEPAGETAQLRAAPNDSKPIVLKKGSDTWIRLWHPHPRWHDLATSHIRPILDAIDELLWWDAAARAFARNRLANAGAVGIPQNLEVPAESDEEAMMSGADRFAKRFFNAAIEAISNPGSASAAVPIFYTYPPNDRGTSGLDYLRMDRPQDALLEQRVQRCLQRISQGLNVPVEVISGIGQATHWGGGQVEESVFREHIEPLAILICNALTTSYLRPILRKLDIKDPEKYLVWYDASQLIVHPDMGQAADQGYQLALIGGEAWRRTRGFSERDKPDEKETEEIIHLLQVTRGRIPPGGNDGEVNPTQPDQPQDRTDQPKKPDAPTQHPAKQQPPVTARGKGQPLLQADASVHPAIPILIGKLETLGDMTVRRALEKAGNKLRSRAAKVPAYKATVRNVPAEAVAATLGPQAVAKLGVDDLFNGDFDNVAAQFSTLCNGVVPSIQTATVGRKFADKLRLIAGDNLYTQPTFESLVPIDLVVSHLQMLGVENLSIDGDSG